MTRRGISQRKFRWIELGARTLVCIDSGNRAIPVLSSFRQPTDDANSAWFWELPERLNTISGTATAIKHARYSSAERLPLGAALWPRLEHTTDTPEEQPESTQRLDQNSSFAAFHASAVYTTLACFSQGVPLFRHKV